MADTHESGLKFFKEGLLTNNPTFVQVLGMCPTLAVTNSLENALVMGGAATFVLVMSNLVTSLLRHLIQPHVRILVFTMTIATFVTIADLFLKAQMPVVSAKLGPFVPLIIVNCIIIARAEVVASKHGLGVSIMDALGNGLGFTAALSALGILREILGSGTLLNVPLFGAGFEPHAWVIMILPPGAFLTLGSYIGIANYLRERRAQGGAQ